MSASVLVLLRVTAKRALVLGGLLTALASPRPASGCDCKRVQMEILPGPDAAAPLNTHIWVFNGPERANYWLRSKAALTRLQAKHHEVGSDRGEGFAVELTQRVEELSALEPLLPRTRYELLQQEFGKTEQTVVSTLTTADAPDASPPRWAGPTSLELHTTSRAPEACRIGMPNAVVKLQPAQDEVTPAEQMLFVATVKYPKSPYYTPTSLHRLRAGALRLEGGGLCDPRDFAFPPPFEKVKVVIKAMDLSGNQSAEHAVEMVGPLSGWDRDLLSRAKVAVADEQQQTAQSSRQAWQLALFVGLGVGCLGLLVTVVILREQ